jgi:2-polyprenyl-6-methoxyphenol hydroxylase-like FAD-dependent oxidoreductase
MDTETQNQVLSVFNTLRAYEARRSKRSAAIIKQSALVDKIGQWALPLLCSLRDGMGSSRFPSPHSSPYCSSRT